MRIYLAVGLLIALFSTQSYSENIRLAEVAKAMGVEKINSLEFVGSGSVFSFGQAFEPGERWPRFVQRSYRASMNYQTNSMRLRNYSDR